MMRHGVRVVCRPEVAAGFALAGMHVLEADSIDRGVRAIVELGGRPEVGVILAQEEFYEGLPEEVRRDLGRRPLPMVVPFPGPTWQGRLAGPEAYIVEILRQAIGYRVRLR
ncbi:MAG: hypothetical protein M5U22_18265 [Thermoleophilia bacterium]|nr:hypothetical protein [Thermoleophilia bacterium]